MSVEVPSTGEFLVRNGKIYPVLELEGTGGVEGEVEYTVYIEADDNGDEVELV